MPQLLLIALAGVGLWYGYKWVRKEQERVKTHLRDAEAELKKREEAGRPSLKQNPETGIYEPSVKD